MTRFLSVENLRTGYSKSEVLHGISLSLDRGRIAAIIGPNGAGKTTLLKAITGFLPVQGAVHVDGQDIAPLSVEERLERGISLVPETRELFGPMTVADNLALGGFRYRHDRTLLAEELERAYLHFPVLRERRGQRASTLSGGERQMLALARAMMSRPALLLLDEPSLGLAPMIVRDVLQHVARLRDRGLSVLLVEQNARAALAVADYAYVLERGEIRAEGPASELAQDARLIDSYLGA